jgi:predicted transcriptional regulator of viral defense system
MIARKLVANYYVSFLSALNYHGFTEQVSNKVFIATTKSKSVVNFDTQEFVFVCLAKNRFFGLTGEWIGNTKFFISDKEKTVIDCLFMPQYGGGLTEVVKAFREQLTYDKLYDYALKMDDLATIKRLGYLLDIFKIKTPIKDKLLKLVGGGFCLLDTIGPKKGTVHKKWRIIENIPKEELMKEI